MEVVDNPLKMILSRDFSIFLTLTYPRRGDFFLKLALHSSFGDRTFAAAGPQVWNSLPPYLRLCGLSYGQFRQLLKTLLFGQ